MPKQRKKTRSSEFVSNKSGKQQQHLQCDIQQNAFTMCSRRVSGSHHQGHISYGEAAGKQCMAVAFLSLAYNLHVKSCQRWSSEDIDILLRKGSQMYLEHRVPGHIYMSVEELPMMFTTWGIEIHRANLGFMYGCVWQGRPSESMKLLTNSLHTGFSSSCTSGMLFTSAGFTVAILHSCEGYHVFDSHSRDTSGWPVQCGRAGLISLASLEEIGAFLINLTLILSPGDSDYELATFILDTPSKISKYSCRLQQIGSDALSPLVNENKISPKGGALHTQTGLVFDRTLATMSVGKFPGHTSQINTLTSEVSCSKVKVEPNLKRHSVSPCCIPDDISPNVHVSATRHQGNTIYAEASGKQSMAVSYVSVAYNRYVKPCHIWKSTDIDSLLWLGSEMFLASQSKLQSDMSVDELPRTFGVPGYNITTDDMKYIYGRIVRQPRGSSQKDVYNGLRKIFGTESATGLVFTVAGTTVAVLRSGGSYHVLDPHARNKLGFPSPFGFAGLSSFMSMECLARFLVALSTQLSEKENDFEMAYFVLHTDVGNSKQKVDLEKPSHKLLSDREDKMLVGEDIFMKRNTKVVDERKMSKSSGVQVETDKSGESEMHVSESELSKEDRQYGCLRSEIGVGHDDPQHIGKDKDTHLSLIYEESVEDIYGNGFYENVCESFMSPGKDMERECELLNTFPAASDIHLVNPMRRVCSSKSEIADTCTHDACKPCMSMAYVSIIYHLFEKPCEFWDSYDIDILLNRGYEMYVCLFAKETISVSDLPRNIDCFNRTVHCSVVALLLGVVSHMGVSDSITDMHNSLQSSFCKESVSGLLFTIAGYTVAIMCVDHNYYVFDAHIRDKIGLPTVVGFAGISIFVKITSLAAYLVNLSLCLSDMESIYEVAVLHINAYSEVADSCFLSNLTDSSLAAGERKTKILENSQHGLEEVNKLSVGNTKSIIMCQEQLDLETAEGDLAAMVDKTFYIDMLVDQFLQANELNTCEVVLNNESCGFMEKKDMWVVKNQLCKKRPIGNSREVRKRKWEMPEYLERETKSAKNKKFGAMSCVEKFQTEVNDGPSYVCCVCHRQFFFDQVRSYCHPETVSEVARLCVTDTYLHVCNALCLQMCPDLEGPRGMLYLCQTCKRHMNSGMIPPQAVVNNLELTKLDSTFAALNTLEQQLLALCLPFQKIISLCKGKQPSLKGPVICVPSDINKTTTALPRPLGQSRIVAVKLKRKLEYKGYCQQNSVCSVKLCNALERLIKENPLYSDIKLDYAWLNMARDSELCDIVGDSSSISCLHGCCRKNDTPDDGKVEPGIDITLVDGKLTNGEANKGAYYGISHDSCLQPIDVVNEISGSLDNIVVSLAPAEGNRPVSIFLEENIEAKAFPSLFPDGKNTYDEKRSTKLTRTKYYNARVMSADNRFAASSQYIFFAQYASELHNMLNSISINLRKGVSGNNFSSSTLLNKESLQKLLKSDQGFRYFAPIRGSPQYWKSTMSELFAMIRNIGIPTWFMTLTSAEISRWTSHISAILEQEGIFVTPEDVMNMDYEQKCKILRSNPVTAVRMFYRRVKLFFKHILLGSLNPIGKVKDYFYRVEFQARGAPHLHLLIWVENAPKFDKDSDEDVCKFINKYISVDLPDKKIDPMLHSVVTSVQMHSRGHTRTCRKGKKACRFKFPRPVSDKTIIVRPIDTSDINDVDIVGKNVKCLEKFHDALTISDNENMTNSEMFKLAGFKDFEEFRSALCMVGKKPSIAHKRSMKDTWVNNYNRDILLAWDGNIDLQYVLDPYSCIMYIVSYISKSESELGEILKQARDEMIESNNMDIRKQMRALGNVYFDHREVSVQEAVVRLCSYQLKECSRHVVFVPTNEENIKMSLPLSVIRENQQRGDGNIWMTSLYDKYFERPDNAEFNAMCQATFASHYRNVSKSEGANALKKGSKHVYRLTGGLGFIQKRTRSEPAIIRHAIHSVSKDPENHFLTLLKLYLPHRTIIQLKPAPFKSYQEFFETGSVKQSVDKNITRVVDIVKKNQTPFTSGVSGLQEAMELLKNSDNLEDAWSMIAPNTEVLRGEQDLEGGEATDQEIVTNVIPELDIGNAKKDNHVGSLCSYELLGDNIRPLLRSLNEEQRQLFYFVQNGCLRLKDQINGDPFHIFVTGGAGVGKSHLIKCIYNEAHRIYRDPEAPSDTTVLLLAPTGTAAHNIGGHTIHSALKIPIDAPYNYTPLSNESVSSLRATLASLRLLIIDEISMVSPRVFNYVYHRLRQIKQIKACNTSACFGYVSVIVLGDFYQLFPVKAIPLLFVDGIALTDLFKDLFKKFELTEIMRQKKDQTFAHMLNRLRVKSKSEPIDPEDNRVLCERVVDDSATEDMLYIFSKNALVDKHNEEMLAKTTAVVEQCEAWDYSKQPLTGNTKKCQLANLKAGGTHDLLGVLMVGVGSRVMLTRNIDVANGLVNGVFGIVTAMNHKDGIVDVIYVKFDSARVGKNMCLDVPETVVPGSIPIKRVEDVLEKNKKIVRQQFPLKLGWAATIHKVQGMTLERCVFDMQNIFVAGQAYVALSRVTSVSGLYIKNYDPSMIYMNSKINTALEKMKVLDLSAVKPSCQYFSASLNVVHQNIQGLRSKMLDIQTYFAANCKIMCFSETWMSCATEACSIPNFCVYKNDRDDLGLSRGGTAIYVADDLEAEEVVFSFGVKFLEMCIVKVMFNKYVLVVVCVYRSPKCQIDATLRCIDAAIDKVESLSKVTSILFIGDYNENLLDTKRKPIYELFQQKGYLQLVKNKTHRAGGLLDAAYVKGQVKFTADVMPTYFSDHEAVVVAEQ